MITLDEAVGRLRASARAESITRIERCRIDADDLAGRILAEDLHLDRDHPPFDRATMDGIACRSTDAIEGATLRIAGELAAGGSGTGLAIPPGQAIRIATGAPVPSSLDVVVERERLEFIGSDKVLIVGDGSRPGRHIHPRGADGRAGDRLLESGRRLDPIGIGLAASVGLALVPVRRRPRIVILATGDELRPVGDPLTGPGDECRIRDGNRPMLAAAVRSIGGEVVDTDRVADDLAATVARLRRAWSDADLVLTIGGVSAGDRDHVPAAADALALSTCFRGVRIQPGRPAAAWTDETGRLRLVGLPGNPVSCLVAMHLLVRPWIDARTGRPDDADWTTHRLDDAVHANPQRTACRPAIVRGDLVRIPAWQGSGDAPHLAGTTGLVRLPEQFDPVPDGQAVPYLPWMPGPEPISS